MHGGSFNARPFYSHCSNTSHKWAIGKSSTFLCSSYLTSLGLVVSAFARSLLHLYVGLGLLAGEGRVRPGP